MTPMIGVIIWLMIDQRIQGVVCKPERSHRHRHPGEDLDISLVVLSLQWPATTCLHWEEVRHGHCALVEEDTRKVLELPGCSDTSL